MGMSFNDYISVRQLDTSVNRPPPVPEDGCTKDSAEILHREAQSSTSSLVLMLGHLWTWVAPSSSQGEDDSCPIRLVRPAADNNGAKLVNYMLQREKRTLTCTVTVVCPALEWPPPQHPLLAAIEGFSELPRRCPGAELSRACRRRNFSLFWVKSMVTTIFSEFIPWQ
jgi:hypothetical protein